MNYPEHLIPKPSYFIIQNTQDLGEYYLIRHTPDKDLIDKDTKQLKVSYIETRTDNLKDLSTNLLAIFRYEDRIFKIKRESQDRAYFNSLWQEKQEVNPIPKNEDDFEIDQNRGAFYLKIDSIVGQPVTHINGDTNEKWTARAVVVHTPTNSNFWHFSVRWHDENGNIASEKERKRKKILTLTKTIIMENAILDKVDSPELDSNLFSVQ